MDETTPLKIVLADGMPGDVEQSDRVSGCPGTVAALPDASSGIEAQPPCDGVILNPRRVRARDADLEVDAEFESVLPPPSKEQLAALRNSLREHNGCTDFIILWAGRKVILDGHTRYRLSREMSGEKDFWLWLGEIELPDRAAALDWIRKHGWARRQLGPVVASCVRGEAYNARKGSWGGDHSDKPTGQGVRLLDVARNLAEEFGVTDRTVRRDGRLAAAVARVVANCAAVKAEDGPRARQALLSPEHRMTRHGIERLDGMEPEEQRKAVAHLVQHKKLPPAERQGEGKVLLPRNAGALVDAVIRLLGIRKAETFLKSFTTALEEARSRAADEEEGPDQVNGAGTGRMAA